MSAAEALMAARAAGIQLWIDGDDLVLEAAGPPPPAVIDLLSSHKAAIMTLLSPAEDGWLARIVGGFEFQQTAADGRTAWRVVAVKAPPLTPSPPFAPSVEKTVTRWSGRI
jgi:hypothetical protein